MTTENRMNLSNTDLLDIQRQARAMQAKAVSDMFKALRRSIVALFGRTSGAGSSAAHTV